MTTQVSSADVRSLLIGLQKCYFAILGLKYRLSKQDLEYPWDKDRIFEEHRPQLIQKLTLFAELLAESCRVAENISWMNDKELGDLAHNRLVEQSLTWQQCRQFFMALAPLCAAMTRLFEPSSPAKKKLMEAIDRTAHHQETSIVKKSNKLLNALEIALGVSHLRSFPLRHLLYITNRCNFRCRTCFQSKDQSFIIDDISQIPLDHLDRGIPAVEAITVGGIGEPLLSPATPALVALYKGVDANVELITNGSVRSKLKDSAASTKMISISMDGAQPATLETIRRGARFENLMDTIGSLAEADRKKVFFNMVVFRANHQEIEELIALAGKLGIGGVNLQEFHAYLPWHENAALTPGDRRGIFRRMVNARDLARDNGVCLTNHLIPPNSEEREEETIDLGAISAESRPSRQEILERFSEIPDPQIPNLSDPFSILEKLQSLNVPNELSTLMERLRPADSPASAAPDQIATEPLLETLSDRLAKGTVRLPHCLAPFASLYLEGNGGLKPCCILGTSLGNVAETDLSTAWNSAGFTAFRERLIRGEVLPQRCAGCKDGQRFAPLPGVLSALKQAGVDIGLIRRPADFSIPASIASHPVVAELGSKVK